jgi:hypothetical protein
VWVSNTGSDTVRLIDPDTNTPQEPIEVDDQPFDLFATSDTVWVSHVGGQSVIPIDTVDRTTGDSIPFEKALLSICVQDGVLWVTPWNAPPDDPPDDRLWRVELANDTNRVELHLGSEGSRSGELAGDDQGIAVVLGGPDEVLSLDENGGVIEPRLPTNGAARIALDGDDLWVATPSQTGIEVVRYDRSDLSDGHRVGDPLEIEGGVDELVVDGDRLWILVRNGTDQKGSLIRRPITA